MNQLDPAPHGPVLPNAHGRWVPWAVILVGVAVLASVLVFASRPGDGPLAGMTSSEGPPGSRDGRLPESGARPSREGLPGVAKVDPELMEAVRRASAAAARDGIVVRITSGWRSRRYQQDLLDRAIVTYGSRAEALRFVAAPGTSRHMSGDAVDIGPTDAAYWFAQHGAAFGLCQTFANEVWHYELLTEPGGTCPPMRPDGSS